MAPLPPLQELGFDISHGRLKETLHQACAQTKGGIIFFFPHKIPLLALPRFRKSAVWEVMATE